MNWRFFGSARARKPKRARQSQGRLARGLLRPPPAGGNIPENAFLNFQRFEFLRKCLHQLLRDGSGSFPSYCSIVDARNGADVVGGARKKDLVGSKQLLQREAFFLRRKVHRFDGQAPIESFLADYMTEDGILTLGPDDVIFLFELYDYIDYTRYSCADFQDLVILVTMSK